MPKISSKAWAVQIASWSFLIALLTLANLLGNASAYLHEVILLLALPFLLLSKTARGAMNRWESYGYLAAFLCIGIAYTFAAGGWSNFDNLFNYLPYILFFPAVGLLNFGAKPQNAFRVALLALAGAALAATVAVYQVHILDIRRAVGFINTTNPFAMVSVMLGFLSLIGFWATKNATRFVFFLGPLLGTYAAILAGTRAAILIVVALCILFAIFFGWKLSKKSRIALAGAFVVMIALGTTALLTTGVGGRAFTAFQSIQHFVTEGTAIDHSVAIRLELYRGGIEAFLDAPIFGHGSRHHVQAARPYMDPAISEEVALWNHLHNDYINFAALAGVFGLVSYGLYLLIPVVGTWKSVRDSQYHSRLYGGWVITLCYAIYGLFGVAFSTELPLAFGVMATAALLGFCRDQPDARNFDTQDRGLQRV